MISNKEKRGLIISDISLAFLDSRKRFAILSCVMLRIKCNHSQIPILISANVLDLGWEN